MWYGQPRVPICLALTMVLLMRAIPQRYCWGDSTASTASHASPTPGSSIRATTDSFSTDGTKSWFLEISDPTKQDLQIQQPLGTLAITGISLNPRPHQSLPHEIAKFETE